MSNRFKRKNAFAVLASAAATVVVSQDAFAQAAEPPADELQEIVVTAQKRAQNAQDVGIALTALAPDSLALTGHQDLTALARQVPSLQVQQFSPATTILNIRGVSQNDFSDAQEAPIAFYLDEVYISGLGAITGHSYDIARVEVLRGPQGTLFGRNATGGLLQVVTAKPSRDFEAFLTVIGGSRNQVSTEGAISGPLSEHVRARLSFTSDNHDGYIKNLIGPDLGSANNYGIRFQIGADLSPNDTINLKVDHLRS